MGTPQIVCAEADGFKCQANDCIADPPGRFLAGLFYYDASPQPMVMRVWPAVPVPLTGTAA